MEDLKDPDIVPEDDVIVLAIGMDEKYPKRSTQQEIAENLVGEYDNNSVSISSDVRFIQVLSGREREHIGNANYVIKVFSKIPKSLNPESVIEDSKEVARDYIPEHKITKIKSFIY